jgi:hypothetical protein
MFARNETAPVTCAAYGQCQLGKECRSITKAITLSAD